jgi:hypothetical protein
MPEETLLALCALALWEGPKIEPHEFDFGMGLQVLDDYLQLISTWVRVIHCFPSMAHDKHTPKFVWV